MTLLFLFLLWLKHRAFLDCINLNTIYLRPSIKFDDGILQGCRALERKRLSDILCTYGDTIRLWIFGCEKKHFSRLGTRVYIIVSCFLINIEPETGKLRRISRNDLRSKLRLKTRRLHSDNYGNNENGNCVLW